MAPVLILSLPFLFLLVRRPVLRRLAVRNAARRPRETALVLVGSLLGTAIITGSLIVGDTLNASIRRSAFTQLGPVDETVRAGDAATATAVAERVRALRSPDVDGVLPVTIVDAAVATAGASRRAEPQAGLLEVDFAAAARFGGDPGATGITGPTPGPGEAAIGRDLARTLHVRAGDHVVAYAYGRSHEVRVTRVLPRLGIAGLRYGFGSASPNIFVAPGTIAALAAGGAGTAGTTGVAGEAGAAGAAAQGSPPGWLVVVSNRGGPIDGDRLSAAVGRQLDGAVSGLAAHVARDKHKLLQDADAAGKDFTQLFQGIGMFGVLAGVLLLVNIFVMLAQERKTEMGMLRAVGLRRAGLVGSFSLEGWLYALASAAIGALAGIGVGRVIVIVASGIFGNGGRFSLEMHFAARGTSIQGGFTAGFLISMVTVVATSLWVSRLNVIRAIRDLPEPESRKVRRLSQVVGALLAVLGAGLTAGGLGSSAAVPILAGPALLGLGAYLVLRRSLPRRPLVSAAAAAVLAWCVVAFSVAAKAFKDAQIPVFVVQGVILTAAAVALVTANQDAIGGLLRRMGGGARNMSLRLGLAYPLARRFRTGMILSMYALVVFTLTFVMILSHLFGGQLTSFTRKISGGFALRVDSNPANPVPVEAVRSRPDVESVSALATARTAQFEAAKVRGKGEFTDWPATAFDPTFVAQGPPALSKRGAAYADDGAAYRAVMAPGSDKIIVSSFFLQEGGGGPPKGRPEPGDPVTLRDPLSGRTRPLHIAAVAESGFGSLLALVPPDTLADLFGPRAVPDQLFVATKGGVDADAVAASLNGSFLANGAVAKSFHAIVDENLSRQQQFFKLMQGYLALGLVVGIAGLGVVMVRAVRERRRQVGVLRALGFEAGAVRSAFVTESGFVALEGIVIGTVLATITSWRLVGSGNFGTGLSFSIPWLPLLLLVVGTFAASLLATATPARQASRIRPAVALRVAD